MRFHVLGPLTVAEGTDSLNLGGPKQRTVLAMLIAHAGRQVSADVIVEAVYGLDAEPRSRRTVQTYVSTLRRQLGDLIAKGTQGWLLEVDRADIDAAEFEDLNDSIKEVVPQDPAHAGEVLRRALSLWKGHPYSDIEAHGLLDGEITRLDELRVAATAARIDADLSVGRHADLIGEIEALLLENPYREKFRAQHMIALYRAGRQKEALRSYQEMRELLTEELGLDPTPLLQELEQQILVQAPVLGVPASTSDGMVSGEVESPTAAAIGVTQGAAPPSGIVTFLFTDIEGSTRLWEEHPGEMRRAVSRHEEVLSDEIACYNGIVFATRGDGVCAAFPSAKEAVSAALGGQLRLREVNWGRLGLSVRVAVHTGAVEFEGGNYLGPPLNRAARLLEAAHGGQVLLSLATEQLVRDELPAGTQLLDLGKHRLRDLVRPEEIFQLVHPDLPREFEPLRSLETFLHNLPVQLTSFVGREQELAEVDKLLRGARLVTLTGPGGSGKTRLALEAASRSLESFADGAWMTDLAAVDGPPVANAVARNLGIREQLDRPVLDTVIDFLRSQELLLILDNCEQSLAATGDLVGLLLRSAPDVKVLVTSRERLAIRGEVTYVVPPLAFPSIEERLPIEVLARYDAASLFRERAEVAQPGFRLTAQNASAVARICRVLDGMPLAIELAAARLRTLGVSQLSERLIDRFGLLVGGERDAPVRHRTLQGAIAWSYELLSESEQALLGRLTVFVGGFTLGAAEEVCGYEPIERSMVAVFLSSLVDKSLVGYNEVFDPDHRYRLLETIREYAHATLSDDALEVLRTRHASHFLLFAERAEGHREEPDWHDMVREEFDNLGACLDWFSEKQDAESAARVAGALWFFWYRQGRWRDAVDWFDRLLPAADALPPDLRAKVLHGAGSFALEHGDFDRAQELLTQELSIAKATGRPTWAILNNLGIVARHKGELERAARLFGKAATQRTDVGRPPWPGYYTNLGRVYTLQGHIGMAKAALQKAYDYGRSIGHLDTAPVHLAEILRWEGDLDAAHTLLMESLSQYRSHGAVLMQTWALLGLSQVALSRGQIEVAVRILREQSTLYQKVADYEIICATLATWAIVACRNRQFRRAAVLLGASETAQSKFPYAMTPTEVTELNEYADQVNEALTTQEAGRLRATGANMTLQESLRLALAEEPRDGLNLP